METCAACGRVIGMHGGSCYVRDPLREDIGKTYHSSCYERISDISAARRALADFEKNGGTTLEELKRELGL